MACLVSEVSTDHENDAVVETFSKKASEILGNKSCMDAENKTRNAGDKWLSQDDCNICRCTGETLFMFFVCMINESSYCGIHFLFSSFNFILL